MQVTVRLFGAYAQEMGDRLQVEVAPSSTPRDLFTLLAGRFTRLAQLGSHCRVAINWEFAEWDTPLQEGDEVAFIPPVSGG